MNIYIIIVTYNAENWLNISIGSVYNQNYTILVIDNASSDKTVEIIKQNYSKVLLVESKENLGFGKANNIGLNIAMENNADSVLLLNQDAWVETDTINKLVNTQLQHPDFWILTPLQRHSKRKCIEENFQKYLDESSFELNVNKEIGELNFANAAIWLMSKQCIEIVGGFDTLFPHYGEDNDYVRRVHFWGGKLGIVQTAIGYHDRDSYAERNIDKQIYKTTLGIVGLLKDINNPLICNLFEQIYRLITKSLKYIMKGDIISFRIYNTSFNKSIIQFKNIHKHRNLSKVKCAFLN